MELTDDQLYRLLNCSVWQVSDLSTNGNSIRKQLAQLGLLSFEKFEVPKQSLPRETGIWKLTDLGHEVLRKDLVRALSLVFGGNLAGAARKHFKYLTMEELPLLLIHKDKRFRTYAKERMEELNGTD